MNDSGPEFSDFTARYVCGECDYDETGLWSVHQEHYRRHGVARAVEADVARWLGADWKTQGMTGDEFLASLDD